MNGEREDYVRHADSARLFVAILLPPVVRSGIEKATTDVRRLEGLRWGSTDQLHITLRFIGETRVERVAAMGTRLAAAVAAMPVFGLDIRGAGAFPSSQRPSVLWVGVRRTRPLEKLHAVVERALATEGIRPEPRSFRPHVTVARVRRGPPPIGLAHALRALDFEASFGVGTVSLMRSDLTPKGARHVEVRSCPLDNETTGSSSATR